MPTSMTSMSNEFFTSLMNGNNYHTISAICDTSLGWIYREQMKKIKIVELLSDAEFYCAFFLVNLIF